MQNVSAAAKALVDSYQKVTLHLYVDGEVVDAGIGAATYSHACGSEEAFTFGNACAGSITLVVAAAMPELYGKTVRVTWDVDGTEYPLITGAVEKAMVSAGRTTIEAYDEMYFGGSHPFSAPEELTGSCTAEEALYAVAEAMGVSVDPDILETVSGVSLSNGLGGLAGEESCSQAAGFLAGLFGMNALISREGLLTMRGYPATGWSTEPYSGGALAENTEYTVTGITFQREETATVKNEDGSTGDETTTVEFFAGDGTLAMMNPLADQAAADRAYESLNGIIVRPGSYSFPGGILLEPGDRITVESMDGFYQTAVFTITMTIDGGVKTDIICGGTNQTVGSMGPINQALTTLQADIARVRKLIAENAEIGSANIQDLTAEQISLTQDISDVQHELSKVDEAISSKVWSEDITAATKDNVQKVEVLYALGDSPETAPDSGWSTTAPAWVDGKFMWQKTVVTAADGTAHESAVTCIAGATGATGEKGMDAVLLQIISSNGHMFKNSDVSTTLTVEILTGGTAINSSEEMYERFGDQARLIWQQKLQGETEYTDLPADDPRISDNGFILALNTEDLKMETVYMCNLDY